MVWWHLRLQLEIPFVFHQCSFYVCWAKGVWEPGQCCLPQCWVIARQRERETGWVLQVICGSHVPFIAEIFNPLGSVIKGMTESLPRVWSIKVCSVSESTNASSEWVWELTVSFVYFTHQYPYSYWQALLFWWHRSGINEMFQNSSDLFLLRPSSLRQPLQFQKWLGRWSMAVAVSSPMLPYVVIHSDTFTQKVRHQVSH